MPTTENASAREALGQRCDIRWSIRRPGKRNRRTALQPLRRLDGDGAHRGLVEMRLHLGDECLAVRVDQQRLVDFRQRAVDRNVEHRAPDRDDAAALRSGRSAGQSCLLRSL